MKKAIALSILFLAALGMNAQTTVPASQVYTWPAAPTGISGAQLGNYIVLNGVNGLRPSIHTVDVTVTGTTPATCTFRVEGSNDAATWYGLDVTSPSTTSCTTNFMESITSRPVLFLRVNLTYTQGDTTTKVIFHWVGGR